MITHHILTLITILHLAYDSNIQESASYRVTEIGSEVLFHTACIFISQFNAGYSKVDNIESLVFLCLCLLVLLNIVQILKVIIQNFRANRSRRKAKKKLTEISRRK